MKWKSFVIEIFSKSDFSTTVVHYSRYVSLGRIGFETTKPSSLEFNYQSKCYIWKKWEQWTELELCHQFHMLPMQYAGKLKEY